MENIKIPPKKLGKLFKQRNLDINIVNALNINIDCDIELIGNKLSIWIKEKKEN